MSLDEQARNMVARNRQANRQREESVLGRAANDVGLTIDEAKQHNWKSQSH
ncbi:MAG: hypothetical protein WCO45_14205 [Pseudanabaena sp. ELA607]|jgi:hypothetical protein